jgi:hypothetical protein
MKILGNLILTIVITLLAFGCGLGEEEEMNKQEKEQMKVFKENKDDLKEYFGLCSHKWVHLENIESKDGNRKVKVCRCYKCGKWRSFKVW